MDDQQFKKISGDALETLQRDLERASEKYDFDVDMNQGALTVEFEEPKTRFVVSPNSPVRQIWVSARVKSFKLDWDEARAAFVFREDGRTLHELMAGVIGEQLDEAVTL